MNVHGLVLDFDGVICDSIDECFASSWVAYFNLYLGRKPAYMPVSLRKNFARLRPLVRGGADFMLIQEILDRGERASRQSEFDAIARRAGDEKMRLFHELFYQAREEMLEKDRESWLSMNRIYPHVTAAFSALRPNARVYVLSTKKPEFIAEILSAKNITLARERILYSGTERKLDIVERVGQEAGLSETTFIDDQIDHLLCEEAAAPDIARTSQCRIKALLATWGYVKEEWLRAPLRVPTVNPQEFLALVEREFA
ncbi:MAG TPA: HAD family hydrolase [Spirochaetia bacterium]|nr:HAD family hydrolase [Spirochaetia bacterium]